jgi:proline iminopeptidase
LITVGRYDWVTPVEMSETIASLIPDSQLVIFEKSGHSPPSDEPELFRRTVRDFLAGVAPEAYAEAR